MCKIERHVPPAKHFLTDIAVQDEPAHSRGTLDRDAPYQREIRCLSALVVYGEPQQRRNVLTNHDRPKIPGVELHPGEPGGRLDSRVNAERDTFDVPNKADRHLSSTLDPLP